LRPWPVLASISQWGGTLAYLAAANPFSVSSVVLLSIVEHRLGWGGPRWPRQDPNKPGTYAFEAEKNGSITQRGAPGQGACCSWAPPGGPTVASAIKVEVAGADVRTPDVLAGPP
jgi:hypothetical protein